MVDTGDLKSPEHCVRAGSSPASGTTKMRKVPSPSGKAAACKAAIPGSNPGGTSINNFLLDTERNSASIHFTKVVALQRA